MGWESLSWSTPADTYEQRDFLNGNLSYSLSSPRTNDRGTITRLSYNTPGYGYKKLVGLLPENTFRFTESRTFATRGEKYTMYKNPVNGDIHETKAWGIFGTPASIVNPFSLTALNLNQINLVKARVAAKIKDVDFDAAVFIGEGKQTLAMFHSFAVALLTARHALGRGDRAGIIRALGIKGLSASELSKSAANLWLLVVYGIRPFISDIEGGLKSLEKTVQEGRYLKSSSFTTYSDNITKKFVLSDGIHYQYWTLKLDTACRAKYRVTNAQLASLASYGLTNPFTLAWELTKLSFVVDWALRVGAWLSAFDAYLGKTFESGSTTQFSRILCNGYYHQWKAPGYDTFKEIRTYGWESVSCKREQLTSFPLPSLPAWRFDPGLFHMTTTLALLRQLK